MFQPYVPKSQFPDFGYGYGWFLDESQDRPVIVSVGGGPQGNSIFATLIIRYPKDRVTMIVLTNQGKIEHYDIWNLIENELF